jgi:hypothetical protein
MTQDDSKLLGACALGIGFGLYTFFKGFREFREYRVVADTPTIPIRSVPMGLVQIRGQAEGDQPVTSPVSHIPCYWYRVVIEHWKTDSRGGGHWEHAHTDTDGVKFHLADATGHIKVDPTSAELDLPQMAKKEVGSTRMGAGGPDEDLLRYVTKAGAHSLGRIVGKGLEHIHPLADPANEEKRLLLANAFQSAPGSPEFMQRIMPLVVSTAKRRLESAGAQADPEHEQARQAMLAAFNHQPGSPEFFQALQGAAAVSGISPQALSRFQKFLGPESDLAMFQPAQGKYRLTESCIVPDATYDITGTCQENPEPADPEDRNMIAKGQNEPTFLISSKTEKQTESGLRRRAVKRILGGAAFALVCAAVILAKLGLLV